MRPLNVIFGIVITLGLAILLGWAEVYAEKRRALKIYIWTGAILVLLVVRFFMPDSGIGPASRADVADGTMPDGYAKHSVETSISAQENWFVGETKECASAALDLRTAQHLGKEPGYVASSITCDKGPEHRVTLKLYGRLNQPEHFLIHWHCTRESDGFTCRQTGAD